jgi:hypothetical protein
LATLFRLMRLDSVFEIEGPQSHGARRSDWPPVASIDKRRLNAYGAFVRRVRRSIEDENYPDESRRIAALRGMLDDLAEDLLKVAN